MVIMYVADGLRAPAVNMEGFVEPSQQIEEAVCHCFVYCK